MHKDQRHLIKGLNQDTTPESMPEGVCRFVLNGVNESIEGDRNAIINERGNAIHGASLEANYWLIGRVRLSDDEHILFLTTNTTRNTNSAGLYTDRILHQDSRGNLTTLVNCHCLNFSTWHPIKGFARVREGCQRTIYWIDPASDFTVRNPPRIMDVDNVLTGGASNYLSTSSTNTGCTPSNAPAGTYFDCEKLRWFRDMQLPTLSFSSILYGSGALSPGTYQFMLQYADKDQNGTAFVALTPPIPITTGQGNYQLTEGGISGLYGDQPKAIELSIAALDPTFEYYRIAVLESNAGTGQVSEVFLSPLQAIRGPQDTFVYGGHTTSYTRTTREAVLIPSLSFDFLDLLQMDGRAFVANIKERNVDHAAFQQQALLAQGQYITKRFSQDLSTGAKSAGHYANARSFMRDELYGFAISWIFNDGYETPPYPFVPRALNQHADGTPIGNTTVLDPSGTTVSISEFAKDSPATILIPSGAGTIPNIQSLYSDSLTGLPFNPHNRPGMTGALPSIPSGSWDDFYYGAFDDPTLPENILRNYHTTAADTHPFNERLQASLDFFHLKANGRGLTDVLYPNYTFFKRWEAYNTAIQTQAPDPNNLSGSGFYTKGEFAYFEADDTYPTDTDCNGTAIWGSLAGQPVRWFKFPDTTLEPHHTYDNSGDAILPIGVEFTNISPPAAYASQVQGYRILTTKRDRQNRTVIDKGLLYHNWFFRAGDGTTPATDTVWQSQGSSQGGWRWPNDVPVQDQSTSYIQTLTGHWQNTPELATSGIPNLIEPKPTHSYGLNFHGPLSKFQPELANPGSYIKVERILKAEAGINGGLNVYSGGAPGYDEVRTVTPYDPGTIPPWQVRRLPDQAYKPYWITNRRIINQVNLPAGGAIPRGQFNAGVVNSTNQEAYIIEIYNHDGTLLSSGFTTGTSAGIAPETINPFPYMSHNVSPWGTFFTDTKSEQVNDSPAHELVDAQVCLDYYGSLKTLNYNIYGGVTEAIFIPTDGVIHTGTTATTFGGDCFISKLQFRKTSNFGPPAAPEENGNYSERHLIAAYVESTINTELRHAGNITIESAGSVDNNGCDNGMVQKYAPVWYNSQYDNLHDNSGDFLMLDYCHHNYYAYNEDYSIRIIKEYYPLPEGFDYCLRCREQHPHRIWHSVKGDKEERTDSYRRFLANDYKDVSGGKGDITSIFQHQGRLFIRTPHTTFRQEINPGEIQTTAITAFLGTGTPLAIPEQEVVTADNGYMGGISRFSIINTPMGTFIPDEVQGRIFMLTDRPEEISNKGLRNWFEENLPFKLLAILQDTAYPRDSFVRNIGYQTVYDDRHKRIILTKRDVVPVNIDDFISVGSINASSVGKLVFISQVPYLIISYDSLAGPTYQEVELSNPTYFRNYSWTISYSLLEEVWMSWHSYLPNFMYEDSNTFYTWTSASPRIWKHNYGPYQTYYGTKQDHIIEVVFPTPSTQYLYHFEYLGSAHLYDSATEHFTSLPYTTFDRAIAFNSFQSTGIRTLSMTNQNPYAGITASPTTATVTRTREQYQINQLWDTALTKSIPLWTKQWTAIQSNYFIDRIPNPAAFTIATLYDYTRLKDTWAGLRLYANPTDNVKLVTNLITVLTAQNYR